MMSLLIKYINELKKSKNKFGKMKLSGQKRNVQIYSTLLIEQKIIYSITKLKDLSKRKNIIIHYQDYTRLLNYYAAYGEQI